MTISSSVRKVGPFTGTGTVTVFTFDFKVFQRSDLYVVKADSDGIETVLVLNTDYTASLNSNQDSNPGGSITLASALASGYTMIISSTVGNLQPTDLTNQGGFYPSVITDALDRATIQIQQLQEQVDRSAKLPITNDTDADELLADILLLANNKAELDVLYANINDIQTVAADLNEPVSEINTVAGSIDNVNTVGGNISNVNTVAGNTTNINTVSGISGNVTTVAGISGNVTTVAGISGNVTTVAGISTNVTAVAGNATNINTVAGDKANIDIVAADKTNIDAVAANKTNIDTVAGNNTNVTTVAGKSTEITAVAGQITPTNNIGTVAGNTTNINTVAGISGNVTTVAGISGNVTTVAGNNANVTTVAGKTTEITTVAGQITPTNNVGTVAGIASSVSTVAGISANVTAVAGNATNINAVAGNATNINAVNANKTNIDLVAGDKTNIDSVAGDLTNINTVAGNTTNINTVAGISGNVTTVAGISSSVVTAATNVTAINDYSKVWLGGKASDPTLRNDGSALQTGDQYFNTGTNKVRVYSTGTAVWVDSGITFSPTVERFSGTGSQTAFTLSSSPGTAMALIINISGVVQTPTVDYTVSGTTLTFTTAPPSGTNNITVQNFGSAGVINVPADGSVTTSKIVDGSVTAAKMATGAAVGNIANNTITPAMHSNSGYEFGMRNRIINGDMRIDQRGSVAITNNTVIYGGADRTLCATLGFATASGTLNKSALNGTTSGYGQWLTNLTTTGSGTLVFGQRIESKNCLDLNSKAVTFTGLVYQGTGSTVSMTVELSKANALDNFVGVTRIGSAVTVSVPTDTITPFSITVTLGSIDANNGLYPSVTFTGLGALTSKNFAVSDLQLEKGSVATPFEFRPYGTELALCQRYYVNLMDQPHSTPAYYGMGAGYTTNAWVYSQLGLPVAMRVTPTPTMTTTGLANLSVVYASGRTSTRIEISGRTTGAVGDSYFYTSAFSASAEL